MDQETDPVSSSSSLCRSGCGFYGSSSTNGLCSKCHKDAVKPKQASIISGEEGGTPSRLPIDHSEHKSIETAVPTIQLASSPNIQPHEVSSNSGLESNTSYLDVASTSSVDKDREAQQQDQKKRNRCNICRRKLGLTGFNCRCGGSFCSSHRYANEHDCTFDYKSLGAQEIKKNNPVVIAEKIKKI